MPKKSGPAAALRAFALALPGAHEDFPWGERVAKVGAKVFLFLGKGAEKGGLSLAMKLPDSAADALELPFTEPTGYGLGKSGWVTASFEPGDSIPLDLLTAWIEESYRTIAPKKLVAELGAAGAKSTRAAKRTSSRRKR
ncbi:MAG: MmcQ/YjbR family DNA-binding protein [Acidobacteriota bacterium]|nr:MmcQ/YjbR family DNA-binding protein [Acidobacteriota bacterium]